MNDNTIKISYRSEQSHGHRVENFFLIRGQSLYLESQSHQNAQRDLIELVLKHRKVAAIQEVQFSGQPENITNFINRITLTALIDLPREFQNHSVSDNLDWIDSMYRKSEDHSAINWVQELEQFRLSKLAIQQWRSLTLAEKRALQILPAIRRREIIFVLTAGKKVGDKKTDASFFQFIDMFTKKYDQYVAVFCSNQNMPASRTRTGTFYGLGIDMIDAGLEEVIEESAEEI